MISVTKSTPTTIFLAVVLAAGISACEQPENSERLPEDELVENMLARHERDAPIALRLENGTSQLCDLGSWDDLFPEIPNKTFQDVFLQRVETLDYVHPLLDGFEASFVLTPTAVAGLVPPNQDLELWVAPWGGQAQISCGAEPATNALVVMGAFTAGEEDGSFDAVRERAARNVEENGLRTALDEDISITVPDPPPGPIEE